MASPQLKFPSSVGTAVPPSQPRTGVVLNFPDGSAYRQNYHLPGNGPSLLSRVFRFGARRAPFASIFVPNTLGDGTLADLPPDLFGPSFRDPSISNPPGTIDLPSFGSVPAVPLPGNNVLVAPRPDLGFVVPRFELPRFQRFDFTVTSAPINVYAGPQRLDITRHFVRSIEDTPGVAFDGQLAIRLDTLTRTNQRELDQLHDNTSEIMSDLSKARVRHAASRPRPVELWRYQFWTGTNYRTNWDAYYRDASLYQDAFSRWVEQGIQIDRAIDASAATIAQAETDLQSNASELSRLEATAKRQAAHSAAASSPAGSGLRARSKKERDLKMRWIAGTKGASFAFNVIGKFFRAQDVWDWVEIIGMSLRHQGINNRSLFQLAEMVASNDDLSMPERLAALFQLLDENYEWDHKTFLRLAAQEIMLETLYRMDAQTMRDLGREITMNPTAGNDWSQVHQQSDYYSDLLEKIGIKAD